MSFYLVKCGYFQWTNPNHFQVHFGWSFIDYQLNSLTTATYSKELLPILKSKTIISEIWGLRGRLFWKIIKSYILKLDPDLSTATATEMLRLGSLIHKNVFLRNYKEILCILSAVWVKRSLCQTAFTWLLCWWCLNNLCVGHSGVVWAKGPPDREQAGLWPGPALALDELLLTYLSLDESGLLPSPVCNKRSIIVMLAVNGYNCVVCGDLASGNSITLYKLI